MCDVWCAFLSISWAVCRVQTVYFVWSWAPSRGIICLCLRMAFSHSTQARYFRIFLRSTRVFSMAAGVDVVVDRYDSRQLSIQDNIYVCVGPFWELLTRHFGPKSMKQNLIDSKDQKTHFTVLIRNHQQSHRKRVHCGGSTEWRFCDVRIHMKLNSNSNGC